MECNSVDATANFSGFDAEYLERLPDSLNSEDVVQEPIEARDDEKNIMYV